MWACPNVSIGDVTNVGEVINIVSCRLLMKSSVIKIVVGRNSQNGVGYIERVRYIYNEKGVRGMG
jgi:hypothetical protein